MNAPSTAPTRRELLRSAGGLVLLLTGHHAAHGASIVAVRVWPAAEYTRVTLESDAPLVGKHFMLANPPRLVIDVEGLELNAVLRDIVAKVRPDDPFIASVRIGQNQVRLVRMAFDLKQDTVPQLFALAPVEPYQHRLVFDLYPTHAPDPLLALIRDKQEAERQAAQAVRDALGEFIGRVDRPLDAPPDSPPVARAESDPPSLQTPAPPPPPSAKARERIDRLVVVAIDPGHGGEDPGAIGPTGLREKDVVLAISLKLRERINAVPGMRAMLTRDADFYVPLHERVRKARRVQADLFVSVHADAFRTPKARGASVFALSENGASSSAARWIANKENAADLVGGVNLKAKDRDFQRMLLDMSTTAQIKDSLRVGHEVLGRMGKVGDLHKEHVEQAGFAVLKAPDIPSILVETAFISNPREEAKLRSPRYQAQLVEALAGGIERYFEKHPPMARQRTI